MKIEIIEVHRKYCWKMLLIFSFPFWHVFERRTNNIFLFLSYSSCPALHHHLLRRISSFSRTYSAKETDEEEEKIHSRYDQQEKDKTAAEINKNILLLLQQHCLFFFFFFSFCSSIFLSSPIPYSTICVIFMRSGKAKAVATPSLTHIVNTDNVEREREICLNFCNNTAENPLSYHQ